MAKIKKQNQAWLHPFKSIDLCINSALVVIQERNIAANASQEQVHYCMMERDQVDSSLMQLSAAKSNHPPTLVPCNTTQHELTSAKSRCTLELKYAFINSNFCHYYKDQATKIKCSCQTFSSFDLKYTFNFQFSIYFNSPFILN